MTYYQPKIIMAEIEWLLLRLTPCYAYSYTWATVTHMWLGDLMLVQY
jgi:hypothetical protein